MTSLFEPRTMRAAVAAITMAFAAAHADAQRYDAVKALDPQRQTNPNGVWSYGYLRESTHIFVTYPNVIYEDGVRLAWQDSGHVNLGTPSVWKNLGSSTAYGVAPGELSLHPGWVNLGSPFDDASVLRFTAPAAGQYAVKLAFVDGDQGETEAWVIKNSKLTKPLVHFTSTTSDPTWNKTVGLAEGDTLDVVVGHAADDFFFDNTPLTLTIRKK